MHELGLLILATAAIPLIQALRRCRWQSLRPALVWALLAWLGWLIVLAGAPYGSNESSRAGRYLALCFSAGPGVAVLGARRPGVVAWNFVVLGLFAVLMLFWVEGLLTGATLQLGGIRWLFVAAALLIGIMNYTPTRLGPAALVFLLGCLLELLAVAQELPALWPSDLPVAGVILGLVPWVGWLGMRKPRAERAAVDRLWLDFRDHYGLVWGERLREQFNRSAANTALPVELRWHGLQPAVAGMTIDAQLEATSLSTLQALMNRFGLLGATMLRGEPAA